jgi:hypothetical protein
VLRLIANRGIVRTASHACGVLAAECRYRQAVHPRRFLFWGAETACVASLAWGFRACGRWGGFLGRYRTPKKRSRVTTVSSEVMADLERGGWHRCFRHSAL